MKKLIFGVVVAVMAMTFSAFTSKYKTAFPESIFYLGDDGNYHELTSAYDPANCFPSPGNTCAWIWNHPNSSPGTNVIAPGLFNYYIKTGYFIAYGYTNRRYIP